ncbi:MAG: TIM-barrel domain-containing protein [Lachnospiraceae bacterium]
MLEASRRPSRRINKSVRTGNALILYSEYAMLKIEPKTSKILRVVCTRQTEFSEEEKPGVLFHECYRDWDFEETESRIRLWTDQLQIVIDREKASICYYSCDGSLLLAERTDDSRELEEFDSYKMRTDKNATVEYIETPDGVKEVLKAADMEFCRKLYRTRLHVKWQEEEVLYGAGQQEEGILNLRGTTTYVHQANLKIAVPLLILSLGYGILTDTYAPMIINDTVFGSYLYTEADVEMDHYFISGGSLDGVVGGYRLLTGKASMLPKWAFGFLQSQERYESTDELCDIVQKHRARHISLDGIVLDWCSWEGELWGQKTFDPIRFPNPQRMMEQLHKEHTRLMISVWPNMSRSSSNYKEFEEKQCLLPASTLYDPLHEKGRRLYWKQAEEGLFCHGIDAWWCDSSEGFTPEWNHIVKPEPNRMYQEFFETCSQHIPAQLVNAYSLFHAMTMYEGQRSCTQDKRVMNLTRSGYTGQQRYGTVLWSGDISASWKTLKKQIVAGLNLCVCGIPYWTVDIGAFFVKQGTQWFWNGEYERGYEDPAYAELFTRWFQFGCFLPLFRSHGTDFRRELWYFEAAGEGFYDALLLTNRLRYRFMPYLYSVAGKVWKQDATMMRMLAFDYAHDSKAILIGDQYLLGEQLMVCPVTDPMYYGEKGVGLSCEKKRKVYLPHGNGWYDFWTDIYYEGGQEIYTAAPLHQIPLFVKEGSILPMSIEMQYVDEIPDAPIIVKIYRGQDAEFELYEDAGDGYGYEQGQYAITKFSWSEQEACLEIGEPSGSFPGMIHRTYDIVEVNTKEADTKNKQ